MSRQGDSEAAGGSTATGSVWVRFVPFAGEALGFGDLDGTF